MHNVSPHIISSLKLPFQFEESKLVRDLEIAQQQSWKAHFNTDVYQGQWTSIALFSPDGDPNNIKAFQDEQTPVLETSVLNNCTYFKDVLSYFKCPLLSVRLLNLGVGASIKPHRDNALGYDDGCFRLHIPITTNDQVEFLLDGQSLTMKPGTCWYTNVNYVHSVSNSGTTDRVHLILDGKRNEWSDQLFFSLAPKEHFIPAGEESYSPEDMKFMLELFKKMDNPAAKELVKQFKINLSKKPDQS